MPDKTKKNILVITRWFPNINEPVKTIFVKNTLDAQAKNTKYKYILISPIPFFPKIKLPFIEEKYRNYSLLEYCEQCENYKVYRPRYLKLPHPLTANIEWYGYLRAVLRVIKKENLQFSLIHSHGLYPDGYVAVKIGEYFGVPVVIHLHDSYFKEIHKTYSQKIDNIMSYCERVITVSEFQKRNIVEIYNNYEKKICTIYNGVDINNFNGTHYERKEKDKLIFVGNLIDVKGVDILIHALNLLKDDISISCDIYGDGKNKEKYQDMVDKLDIGKWVKFKGWIDHDILPKLFQKYSFLVLPSRYETFGIVLIEAMACGIPVIATRVGAVSEIVSSEDVGILVEPDSPELLAEGIKNAINKDWNRELISNYAKKFSIEKTAREIEKVYDEILKSR